MDLKKMKEDIVGKLVLLAILSAPAWISYSVLTVLSVGRNTVAITANTETITELAETLGGMNQLFGNAQILENGQSLTVTINVHSDAGRWSQRGRRLIVVNTGDSREMSTTVTVEGKFEGEPHLFLNMSRAAGRAIGASPGDEIQVSIQPADDK